MILFTPTYLQTVFKVAAKVSLQANSVAIVCLTCGCVLFGFLADRIGSKWALSLGSLALLGSSSYFYHSLPLEGPALFLAYGITGLFVGSIGVVPYILVRAFPPKDPLLGFVVLLQRRLRHFRRLTPVVLTLWLKSDRLAPAHYVAALALFGCVLGFVKLPSARST